jgi:hypothetical protein
MSGPKTATLLVDPVTVLLVAAGLRAAHALQQGYAEAAHQREQHAAQRDGIEQRQQQADVASHQALLLAEQQAQQERAQLLQTAERLGLAAQINAAFAPSPESTQSQGVQGAHPAQHVQYVQALQAWNEQVRALLRLESARRLDDAATLQDELTLPAGVAAAADTAVADSLAAASHNGLANDVNDVNDVNDAEACQTTARRLLARLTALGSDMGHGVAADLAHEFATIPDDIRQLARTLAACVPGERATLLAMDLRLRIQRHIEAVTQKLAQQASSLVLEQTLKDLGYQVEGIAETLFVEGGVVHFRRQGWGNHMVRLRINPAAASRAANANFNVIRKVAEVNNETSVQDHSAEDRWCSEFPLLMQTLAARGIQMQVTRHLGAGELPVQQVLADKLPTFADEEGSVLQGRSGKAIAHRQSLPVTKPIPRG